MKAICKHCKKEFCGEGVRNSHTHFISFNQTLSFESIDDFMGIDICKICDIPAFWFEFIKPKEVVYQVLTNNKQTAPLL